MGLALYTGFCKGSAGEMKMARGASQWVQISGYLFLLGVLISIVAGVAPGVIPATGTILVLLGALIGLLGALGIGSVGKDEAELFLLATVALIAAGGAGTALSGIPSIGTYLRDIVNNIAALVVPAAVIMALEAVWRAGSAKVMA